MKAPTTIRFDADVLAALKATGPGWQTRVNPAMREWASWRGALEFRFARQLGPAERGFNRSMCYPPFDPEFSATEMANLVSFLCAFIDGTVDAFQRTRTLEDFALRVPSEKTLFGVRKGVFFLEQYDNEDKCCITAGGRAL